MEPGNQGQGDLAPHGIIFEIKWEVHPRLPDGRYAGQVTDKGNTVFDIRAQDRGLALEYVTAILESIKRNALDVNTIEVNEERLGQAQLSGASESRRVPTPLFGMRGAVGRNHAG